MTVFLTGCMALIISAYGCQRCDVAAQSTRPKEQQVAKDFSYPESPETVRDEVPYEAKSLSGNVGDVTDSGLETVLVERLGSGWGKRVAATFSDSNGSFSLPRSSNKTQYLRFSKPGFNTLLIRVVLTKKPKARLSIKLGSS